MNEKKFISVTTLNKYLKNKFDSDPHIQNLTLKGEISNFKGHTRGHLYFTLKDETSRINAVMFQYSANKLTFTPENGMKVLVEGKVSIYEANGAYQIYVQKMEEDGLGNLHLKYEALKKELSDKGLFNAEHKKPIPKYPERIGVVTASTGAAIKDILSTIKRRYPVCETYLFPSLVQGPLAKDNIVTQIKEAENHNLDILIVGRGGGSIEDLWPFNEEEVALAIYECYIPVISAVGHEIDFTIADFVADLRAPTPTAAAELAVPNQADLNIQLNQYHIRALNLIKHKIKINEARLLTMKDSYVLSNPLATYEIKEQKLSNLITNLNKMIKYTLTKNETSYNRYKESYMLSNPKAMFKAHQNSFNIILNKLELLNPISVLNKGYSVTSLDSKIIKTSKDVKVGDILNIKLFKGEVDAIVEKVG